MSSNEITVERLAEVGIESRKSFNNTIRIKNLAALCDMAAGSLSGMTVSYDSNDGQWHGVYEFSSHESIYRQIVEIINRRLGVEIPAAQGEKY